jgi:hypothetical protein
MDFFYDQQIRRYLLQFIRVFADLSYQETRGGALVTERVPIMYGDPNRMVASILRENSENVVMPSPMMSAWIRDIEMDPGRRRDPMFNDTKNIVERNYDKDTGYGTEAGNMYTLQRYMPVPYKLTFQLDIWTTSTTTKLQLLEQILVWFNDALTLQQNDNAYDWTNIFELQLTNTQWSSRSIPQGSVTDREITSLTFEAPIWLNPPAKLKSKQWIEQVVTNIVEINDLSDREIDLTLEDPLGCFNELDRLIVTPGDYKLEVGYEGQDVVAKLISNDPDETPDWNSLLTETYGLDIEFTDLYIKTDNDIESEDGDIIGQIDLTNEPDVVKVAIDQDTVPGTTAGISPINRIVNPVKRSPGNELPGAITGQRYLITSDTSNGEEPAIDVTSGAWGALRAYPNDIIQYNGAQWQVVFEAATQNDIAYTVNSFNMQHYKYVNGEWIFTYLGEFNPGYWRLYSSK